MVQNAPPPEPAAAAAVPDLVPARMVNEVAYCPRLFYLEWVQGEFVDNYFTVHGRAVHERSDRPSGVLAEAAALGADAGLEKLRSLTLSSDREGLVSRIDVLEVEGGTVSPVEFKRGRAPSTPERAWEPERVQVCAQALVLRDNGYRCDQGFLYFTGSKERIPVRIDEALVARTRELVVEVRRIAAAPDVPPPLVGSKKCEGCSLAGVCLPDEIHLLAGTAGGRPRRLLAPRDDAVPLYVQGQGQRIGLTEGLLRVVKPDGALVCEARLEHTSQVCVFGAVQVSTPAIRELCNRETALCFFSRGGWFYGRTEGIGHKNVELRRAQYRLAEDERRSLPIARSIVESKIANSRTLLRRNHPAPPPRTLRALKELALSARAAESTASLLGIEGSAARAYFELFQGMLKSDNAIAFDMDGRTRRPPRDPVNAMLSFVYAVLAKDCTLAVVAAGFDPYLGFYHRPRYGRPALALDLMEEQRPLVADSVVLTVVNNRIIGPDDFVTSGGAVALRDGARRALLQAYERRMDELIAHPVFGYRLSYRRVLAVQARLLARYVSGEIHEPPQFRTR